MMDAFTKARLRSRQIERLLDGAKLVPQRTPFLDLLTKEEGVRE